MCSADETLPVVSTHLFHWLDQPTAERRDGHTAQAILDLDPAAVGGALGRLRRPSAPRPVAVADDAPWSQGLSTGAPGLTRGLSPAAWLATARSRSARAALSPPPARGRIGVEMPTDVQVILDDRPGELARLGEATGGAGVNVRGMAAFTGEGKGVVHVLVDDADLDRLRDALAGAGVGIADEREVLVVDVEDRPGTLGELTRRLAAAKVNIDLAYTTFGGVRVVFATDDLRSARAALG